jgi:hypothetical protein
MKLYRISPINFSASHIWLICFITAFSVSCTKKDTPSIIPPLPALTTKGANTFGTYIDEELWLPRVINNDGQPTLCVSFSNNSLSLSIIAIGK